MLQSMPKRLLFGGGKIVYVGESAEAMTKAGKGHTMIDLEGKTLVPGFIDGHSHFSSFGAQAVCANLLASPDGKCNTIPELISELKDWYKKNGVDKTNGWIVGLGFDDAALQEHRFPTKEDLDQVSTDLPVMACHISGHFSVVNSKGLELLNITKDTKDPAGGIIRRMPNSQEPNGVMEELASIPAMLKVLTPSSSELGDFFIEKGFELATSYGYTTAQEGRAMENHLQLADYAKRGKMPIDVNSYVDYMYPQYMETEWYGKVYKNHYRIAGIKLTLDGSPQGRTAWRTVPYTLPPDGQNADYRGYPAIPDDNEVARIVDMSLKNNWQMQIHCNGDAALDQYLKALEPAVKKYGNNDRRNTLIHGQLIRTNQIDSLKKYDIVASLFPMHTFYWGDWYKQIIGKEAAMHISPIKTCMDKGVHVTSHTDAPVALPNLMMIMHTTVNRVSRTGDIIGKNERLTPYEAMKCITSWSAYQLFEDDIKGTLSEGKLADLVILDKNPLKVDPMTLKDIKVLETIKEGKSVYKRK
ncbi:amidohydrolase [Mangrovimonas sp. YM274]|uniref:amidohydrolase n=1 Tax=Mangrovimonas sp. YM274 TaxID=3070660 RepID=UPI0027DB682F|nr:amidohydrolase [Mangrovimonas sp. YM274]WMI70282.1 amidohydrolase [Mangrovimonas sp. YM274]